MILVFGCAVPDTVRPEDMSVRYILDVTMNEKALYNNILAWLAENGNSSRSVLKERLEKPTAPLGAGKITGRGYLDITLDGTEVKTVNYTIKFLTEENRCTMIFDNFKYNGSGAPVSSKEHFTVIKYETRKIADSLLEFLQKR
jgi:hypothetical protein